MLVYIVANKLCFFVDVCWKTKCHKYASCVNKDGRPVCVCQICSDDYVPVCGSDGITYASECYLKRAACLMNRQLDLAKDGPCGKHF